jgi:hypothetical protein
MYHYAPTLQFVTPCWLFIAMEQHASADAPKKANTRGRARRNGTLLAQRDYPVGVVRYCALTSGELAQSTDALERH